MIRHFIAPLFWAITILFISSIPTTELPDYSFWRILSFDKAVHAFMYGLLAFLMLKSSFKQYSFRYIRYNAIKFSMIASIIYGICIEFLQEYFLPDRHGDWMDAAANTAGAFAGLALFRIIFPDARS